MPRSTLIANATIIDADACRAQPGRYIVVRGGLIEAVTDAPPAAFDETIDASHAYVCPGLIDAHVHLFLNAGRDPLGAFLIADDDAKMRVAAVNARRALDVGITTIRDCGAPARLLFAFRRSVARGDIAGPRILAAGSPLTRPRGHCHFFGIEVSTARDVQSAIATLARQGADFVKLIASGGGLTPGTRPSEADLPLELMREAVTIARAHGLSVSAHCHATASIVRALDAGVETIEHASFTQPDGTPQFDPEIAARLKDEGAIVTPTVISGVRIAQTIRESGMKNGYDCNAIARLEARRDHIAKFREMGVRIMAGADCGVAQTPFDSLVDELAEYVNAGMSCAAALRSATSDSARFLHQPGLGEVKRGFAADLLLLDRNPLESLEVLRKPLLVLKGGEIVCDRRNISVRV